MSTNRTVQLGAAMALVELLKEHPELAAAGWSLDAVTGSLNGFVHEESVTALEAYAEVLGAEVTPGLSYVFDGRTVSPYRLSTVWRDVPVSMAVTVPVVEAVTA
ncbi:hypothetical protein [Streptomyces sp. NBC_01268]|uniref:hypothetical protein n=1 Tax=Streptomyces sp. NBC_01268 TaxID=2903806 RepID=UPI002E2F4734|nr:hypothetical protein [Streptomyces sp. NBC_01268]